ncbi:type II toxin-antitoxin system HicB family antitoxin [Coleofasciculus sp. FACHB-T130]|uniref:type II toxin-antitoxin system HicB family antitoxin n=1 Tax=Cyanophyceae TaxID=3028117 RepID=UPI001683B867|nr:type II toxin-antitoxin system HicB family antitoxin [Coleofasciculus sp. FACHB-T130]MBD1878379.1 type II toxin-antitoxin system HicB family antitoxin [Coleofasciculus sp. FACHB-T130]
MIDQYLLCCMKSAQYESLGGEVGFYGEIPQVPGVWATGRTLEACARELLEVLEEWVNIGVARGYKLPICEES